MKVVISALVSLLVTAILVGCDERNRITKSAEGPSVLGNDGSQSLKVEEDIETFSGQIGDLMLDNIILPLFHVEDLPLSDALIELSRECNKCIADYGQPDLDIGIEFPGGDERKVTLTTKNNSARVICDVIVEQTGSVYTVDGYEVQFSLGVWDMMGGIID